MIALVPVALFGWIAVPSLLFALLPRRRAVVTSVLLGVLFLPNAKLDFPGFPDFTKFTGVSLGLLVAATIYDLPRVARFRPRWFDAPMLLWTLIPFATSIANGLGPYDGLAVVLKQIVIWAVPYAAGRLYFSAFEDLRDIAFGVVLGGLLYVPLCWIEIRLSPQLHTWVWGYHQHSFSQTRRFGGFRPTVFMEHGLMVSLWMVMATLTAAWAWWSGAIRRVAGVPIQASTAILGVTMIGCKSVGATFLLATGLAALAAAHVLRTRIVLTALVAFPLCYALFRVSGIWSFDQAVEFSTSLAGEVAGGSLKFRIDNENELIDHSLRQPWLGWGGWLRNRPEGREYEVVSDGMWVIALSHNGILGAAAYLVTMLLPSARATRIPAETWRRAELACALGLAHVLALVAIDMLFNANVNQVYVLATGALASALAATRPRGRRALRRVGPARGGARDRAAAVAPPHAGRVLRWTGDSA